MGKNITRKLKELTKSLIEALHKGNDTSGIIGKMISAEGLELFNGLRSSVTPHSSYTTPDLLMLQLMEYNIFEFAASKTEARLASMTELLIDKEKQKLREFNEFKKLAEEKVKKLNTNYLLTEYNHTVAVGQNSAAFVRFMAEKDTVTNLVQYRTVGDNKVRHAHKVLDGLVFDLNDKEAMDLLAPNGHGCRCEFVQYFGNIKPISGKRAKELLRESDPKFKGSSFEVNRADLAQVFTKKEFYTKGKNFAKFFQKLTFDTYGLKAFKNFKASLNKVSIDKTITKDNAHELFKKSGTITKGKTKQDYVGFSDYLKRKMILTKDVFKKHVADDKFGLYPLVKQALKAPDEVWYYEHTKDVFKSRYVSFFKDGILVIDADLDKKQGLNITSWDFVKDNSDKEIRKGLLIKTK
ncbi:Phage head morphogenesis domain protein [Tenacibaculum maritimum]|nr:Phage head morphogenesis domain protein [Tenacibaculum maritimum]